MTKPADRVVITRGEKCDVKEQAAEFVAAFNSAKVDGINKTEVVSLFNDNMDVVTAALPSLGDDTKSETVSNIESAIQAAVAAAKAGGAVDLIAGAAGVARAAKAYAAAKVGSANFTAYAVKAALQNKTVGEV